MEWMIGFLGLAVGSFINVLIDRLPRGENIIWGRSHCDHCRKPLRWFELIPLLSYVIQGGRCRRCRQHLSLQYPIVELATGSIFFFSVTSSQHANMLPYEYSLQLGLSLITVSALIVIFVADLKYLIIPDSMLVVLFWAAVVSGVPLTSTARLTHLYTAVGAFAFFWLLWFLTRGRGLGFGDVKLAGVLGLLLGFPQIVIALYVAFLTGAVVGVILMLARKKSWKSRIAFGPFLIAGAFTSLLFGSQVVAVWRALL